MTNTTSGDDKTPGLLKAAWLIAVVTIFSKLIGFIRDVVIANYYGASTVSDAYFYAYQIPALAIILLGGVGGPFHSATVAVFSKLIPNLREKPKEDVNKLYSTFMTTTIIFFTILAVLCYFFAPQIMGIIASGGDAQLISLAAEHLKIMSPVLIIGGIVGIYYGILVTYRYFMLPNLSPIIMSLVIIAMVMGANGKDNTGAILAWATTIGAVFQWVMQYPKIRQLGFRLKPNLDVFNNPELNVLGKSTDHNPYTIEYINKDSDEAKAYTFNERTTNYEKYNRYISKLDLIDIEPDKLIDYIMLLKRMYKLDIMLDDDNKIAAVYIVSRIQ